MTTVTETRNPDLQKGNEILSAFFRTEEIKIGGTTEQIVKGGERQRATAIRALKEAGIKQIGVIGWGSQAPAQAQNLWGCLKGSGIKVVVGLREGSQSASEAREAGFTEENGTLGEMFAVVKKSDLVLLLINDNAQVMHYRKIFSLMKKGAFLGFSHGFLIKYLKDEGIRIPKHINIIGCCPKGMGDTVRRLFQQGSGINCSITVEQNGGASIEEATDVTLAWGTLIGAPFMFQTTLEKECISDLTGERSGLLAAPFGLVEALYQYFIRHKMGQQESFIDSVDQVARVIRQYCSRFGVKALFEYIQEDFLTGGEQFRRIYNFVYPGAKALIAEIYDEVASGNEIRSVIMANQRLGGKDLPPIAKTNMWRVVGPKARESIAKKEDNSINTISAGALIAILMALTDVLSEHGHVWTEIANESWIELFDSLLSYMEKRGIDAMVDGCSMTARLGTRKWWASFFAVVDRALELFDKKDEEPEQDFFANFLGHPIHDALRVCYKFRPPSELILK